MRCLLNLLGVDLDTVEENLAAAIAAVSAHYDDLD